MPQAGVGARCPPAQQICLPKSTERCCRRWRLRGEGRAGVCCVLIEPFPPPALDAVNLLLQMANFKNPLIRIRSSTSIFIYF